MHDTHTCPPHTHTCPPTHTCTCSFKGVQGLHSLVSVSSAAMSGRRFVNKVKKSKGVCVEPGQGTVLVVDLQVRGGGKGQCWWWTCW